MATNVYFNNFSPAVINQQRLMLDLVTESIQMHGCDVQYMPRDSYDSTDRILGEAPKARYDRAYNMEMYLANVQGYEGQGDYFSKFGIESRETYNLVVAARTFQKYVPSGIATRPREGDLIWVSMLQKLFEIKFVEEELLFFSLGYSNPYMYELRCEDFRFSQEDLNTGVQEIDDLENELSYAITLNLSGGSGNYNIGEFVYQGASLANSTAKGKVKDWDPITKVLQIVNIKGQVIAGLPINGETSGMAYTITSYDDLADNVYYDEFDNRKLQDEVVDFIDLTEINPFGQP